MSLSIDFRYIWNITGNIIYFKCIRNKEIKCIDFQKYGENENENEIQELRTENETEKEINVYYKDQMLYSKRK